MNLKNIYKPDREFKAKTKNLFLAKFTEKFGTFPRTSFAFKYFARGIGVGVSFAFILGVTAIYADGRNVGPENILYGFKRSQEAVSITFSRDEEKSKAHVRFAERRLNEIKEIQGKNPESPLIMNLKNDLAREIKSSVKTLKSKKDLKFTEKEEVSLGTDTASPTEGGIEVSRTNKSGTETPPAKSIQNLMTPSVAVVAEKSSKLCRSWDQVIDDDGELVLEAVNKDSELKEWFEKNCFARLRGFSGEENRAQAPKEDSEKNSEVEN
ncbi:MAG: DUF5667 domain-containing protein [Patescibacteria group bacterium]